MSTPLLTIAIPTVITRYEKFNRLRSFIDRQIDNGLHGKVEIISLSDNKEMSIGTKRDKLYRMAKGEYTVMIDDDDWVADNFCANIYGALIQCLANGEVPDCIGYIESTTFDGKDGGNSLFSIDYQDWIEQNVNSTFPYGCVRVRTPFFKTPIKTSICLQVGVKDMRHGEDHDFAKRVKPFLKTECFIPEVMYKYGFVTEGEYFERFGIKK